MPTYSHGKPLVLVSDFDGTMTRHDFYQLAIERLIPWNVTDYWEQYRSGAITHFEALRRYFAAIHVRKKEVLRAVNAMGLDPKLPQAVEQLQDAGWEIVVASAGCGWYIERLLTDVGVSLTVYANPGRFVEGVGLLMEKPTGIPFRSETLGVDKAGVVQHYLAQGGRVAFAGDGFPDADAARLVSAENRFARGDLAHVLQNEGLEFRPFAAWSEIATALIGSPS